MTTGYDAQVTVAEKLKAAGINATADPRSATPPCVLVLPPDRVYDLPCGWTGTFVLMALVPGTGNADAARALSGLVDAVAEQLPVERAQLSQYVLAADAPPLPAYRIEYSEGV